MAADMMNNGMLDGELDFEQLMQQRMNENFGTTTEIAVVDDRLKEMNKRLPEWSLEPPYSFLK